jgi:glycyl-tRNA synthetase
MRWNDSKASFSRPVRWVVALHDSAIVPFEYAGFSSGRTSRGLRPLGSPSISIPRAADYLKVMEQHGIVVDRSARQAAIIAQLERVAASVGGRVPEGQEALLEEVTDLVEAPYAALGSFEETHLSLPSSVLVTVMKKHQRYFPVEKSDGSGLLPHFVVVCNGERSDMKLVVQGYEDVLRARYADAAYFVLADRKKKLSDYREALRGLTFQADLGSMLDKQIRLEGLVADLARELQVGVEDTRVALKAAGLAKNDLVTSMVVEMTSLQGVLGEVYALDSGEEPAVAQAIREHYLPKAAGGTQPESLPGVLLGVADRLDSLVGLFAVGKKPTGSADPFGLRRHALTLIDLLVSRRLSVPLGRLFEMAAAHLPVEIGSQNLKELLAFTMDRMVVWFKEQGHRHDLVEAAVFGGVADPYRISQVVEALSTEVQGEAWDSLLNAYARCCRIVKSYSGNGSIPADRLSDEPSKALLARYNEVSADLPLSDVSALVEALSVLQPAIDEFFDKVLVMVDDEALKNARLALLNKIAKLPQGLVDLSRVEGF